MAGYPKRPVPKRSAPRQEIGRRTLTNLYNERPKWLVDTHEELDAAVAAAYRWEDVISDEDALSELLQLNLATYG